MPEYFSRDAMRRAAQVGAAGNTGRRRAAATAAAQRSAMGKHKKMAAPVEAQEDDMEDGEDREGKKRSKYSSPYSGLKDMVKNLPKDM